MESSGWGCFALVSYIPAPLASYIEDIRNSLSTVHLAQPHITLLPPRSLRVENRHSSECLLPVLRKLRPVSVSLDGVATFQNTGILYLNIRDGHADVWNLHDELNRGEFSAREQYEFVPHVTLAGPMEQEQLAQARHSAAEQWGQLACRAEFTIEEVVALHAAEPGLDWTCLWRYNLRTHDFSACGVSRTSTVECRDS